MTKACSHECVCLRVLARARARARARAPSRVRACAPARVGVCWRACTLAYVCVRAAARRAAAGCARCRRWARSRRRRGGGTCVSRRGSAAAALRCVHASNLYVCMHAWQAAAATRCATTRTARPRALSARVRSPDMLSERVKLPASHRAHVCAGASVRMRARMVSARIYIKRGEPDRKNLTSVSFYEKIGEGSATSYRILGGCYLSSVPVAAAAGRSRHRDRGQVAAPQNAIASGGALANFFVKRNTCEILSIWLTSLYIYTRTHHTRPHAHTRARTHVSSVRSRQLHALRQHIGRADSGRQCTRSRRPRRRAARGRRRLPCMHANI